MKDDCDSKYATCGEMLDAALAADFVLHSAQRTHLLLTTWLPEGVECRLPEYAHTTIGIGGFVLDAALENVLGKARKK